MSLAVCGGGVVNRPVVSLTAAEIVVSSRYAGEGDDSTDTGAPSAKADHAEPARSW